MADTRADIRAVNAVVVATAIRLGGIVPAGAADDLRYLADDHATLISNPSLVEKSELVELRQALYARYAFDRGFGPGRS